MKNYIKNKQALSKGNYLTIDSINVIVKDELQFDFDIKDLENVLKRFPRHFLKNVDYIMFGNFDFLRKKNYNASYMDSVIYVSSTQDNNMDIVDDIVHEIGHSVEETYESSVYGDGALEHEFLQKRQMLKAEFENSDIFIPDSFYEDPEYNEVLDDIFSNKIGYPVMTTLSQGIYYSPYGATSLKEYFANGFEAYFYHKDLYLKKVSPVLFSILEKLEMEEH